MSKSEILEEVHPKFLRRILAPSPFIPESATACYQSGQPDASSPYAGTYQLLIASNRWLHLVEVSEQMKVVSRHSITGDAIIGVESRWKTHSSFEDEEEALSTSGSFTARVRLKEELGSLGQTIDLPLRPETDYEGDQHYSRKPAQAFVEALLKIKS